MLPLVLESLLESYRSNRHHTHWKRSKALQEDLDIMKQEADTGKEFDTLGLKQGVWTEYSKGKYQEHCYESSIARIVALLPAGMTIPLEDWGAILQWFGPSRDGKPWKIYWFGATVPRKFPGHGQALEAAHLNGGYTIVCSTAGIFIYRIEEATRVLIHEMLHAACLDPNTDDIQVRESTVETWAELILIAFRAKGSRTKAATLWAKQAQWIADTNNRAATAHNVRNASKYGYRYLNGRVAVFASLGIQLPPPSGAAVNSSRFTSPVLD
jgi:hypothetical protein